MSLPQRSATALHLAASVIGSTIGATPPTYGSQPPQVTSARRFSPPTTCSNTRPGSRSTVSGTVPKHPSGRGRRVTPNGGSPSTTDSAIQGSRVDLVQGPAQGVARRPPATRGSSLGTRQRPTRTRERHARRHPDLDSPPRPPHIVGHEVCGVVVRDIAASSPVSTAL